MTKYLGATDAFNAIVQRVDETLIQAEAHFRTMRADVIGSMSDESLPERTVIPSPIGSERSCSPNPQLMPPSPAVCPPSESSMNAFQSKCKSYLSLDKKKAVVMTSLKSKKQIEEAEIKKAQKLIEDLFGIKSSTSSSSILQI